MVRVIAGLGGRLLRDRCDIRFFADVHGHPHDCKLHVQASTWKALPLHSPSRPERRFHAMLPGPLLVLCPPSQPHDSCQSRHSTTTPYP